jgi:4-hydroxy-2-oxoheptanedioate aldolase
MTHDKQAESFRSVLQAGGAIGSWCGFASFASVEAMTFSGVDFLVLDMQHSEFTQSHFPAILGAFPEAGRKPWAVVRAAQNDYHLINWLFDQGVPAVLVPMVNSPELARQAVEAARFPPVGRRSFGPFRAARYGSRLASYMAGADEQATLIVQIEDAEAARRIDSLITVPGVDAVFMGPNDLAYSMLRPGEQIQADPEQWSAFARTPEVLDLCEHVLQRCRASGVPFGMTSSSIGDARDWLQRGASFVTFGSDFGFLRAGIDHLLKTSRESA